MKIWTPLLLCLISCGSKEKDVANTEPESIQEEIQAPIQTEQENSQSKTAENFPLYWEMLTEEEGEFIIFQPCDAGNLAVSLNEKRTMLNVEYGQDAMNFDILSMEDKTKLSTNENKKFIILKLQNQFTGADHKKFEVIVEINPENKHSVWRGLPYRENDALLMISAQDTASYKHVRQPCSDCWDNCE